MHSVGGFQVEVHTYDMHSRDNGVNHLLIPRSYVLISESQCHGGTIILSNLNAFFFVSISVPCGVESLCKTMLRESEGGTRAPTVSPPESLLLAASSLREDFELETTHSVQCSKPEPVKRHPSLPPAF